MITLTRLNREPLMISAMQIESIDTSPDTRVTLVNGKQLYVCETPDEITELVRDWYRSVFAPLREER